tara:strand:+ start:4396 stop:6345 length:1950 start_codon:yes stop_codon:yes gene_type:complete
MSDNQMKDWKRPISVSDYCQMTAKPIAVEKGKRNFFETKDSKSASGHSLRARVRMTFAGLPTLNGALYLPDEMYKGVKSWTKPYNRPIQKHHNDGNDPIGRVIDARYIDTTNQAAQLDSRIAYAMRPFKDKKSSKNARLASVPIFQELANNEADYRGVGHIEGLWNVSDPDAIQKILDGRLLTVSTSFMPKGAWCSGCAAEGELTDWRVHDCDHNRGDVIDGHKVVAVPFGFVYDEVSTVNGPAAEHARILETGEHLSFADAVADISYSAPYPLVTDAVIVLDGKGYKFSDSTSVLVPESFDNTRIKSEKSAVKNSATVIDNSEHRGESSPEGTIMTIKLKDLVKDTASNYEEVAKHLPEGAARLTGDILLGLDDAIFIGPNKTFPVKDAAHGEAIKKLLEEVADSDSKTAILELLETAVGKLVVTDETVTPEEGQAEGEADEAGSEPAGESDEKKEEKEEDALDLDSLLEAGEFAKITKVALEALTDKVEDLEMARDMLKRNNKDLTTDLAALKASHSGLLKDQKEMLANRLVDAEIASGVKVTDKTERVTKLKSRTLTSLKDSLSDLTERADGMSRQPTGEQADNPVGESDSKDDEEAEDDSVDTSAYGAIVDRYFEISFGPKGQRAADAYLNEQKRQGIIPAHVKL